MTKLAVVLVLAAAMFALSGGLFFAAGVGRRPGTGSTPAAGDRALEQRLASQVEQLAERLDRLESALAAPGRRSEPDAGSTTPAAPAAGEPAGDEPETAEALAGEDEQQLLASILKGQGSGGLRNYVQKCIRDERDERRRRELEKFEEHRKEMAALSEGPYGKYNFRINSFAKRLGLSERQKEQYYALLADYGASFDEARKNVNRDDPVNYKAYQERKKQLTEEFQTIVIQTLNPSQAEEYAKIPDYEKSPDPKSIADAIQITLPGGEAPMGEAVFFSTEVMGGAAPAPEGADAVIRPGVKVTPPPAK